ncbi:thioredoxin-like domain-containing protein [Bacteroides sp.]
MNKYILFVLISLCTITVCGQTPAYQIKGKVDTVFNGNLVTLFTFTGDYIRSVDSTYVENGRFHFEGPAYIYEKSLISIGNYPDTVLVAELFLEQGPIEVEMAAESKVNSPMQREYQQYLDSCTVFYKQIDALQGQAGIYEAEWQKLFAYKFQFKKKHIHNGLGRTLFSDEAGFLDDHYFFDLYEMLTEKDKNRGDVKSCYEYRMNGKKQFELKDKQFLDFSLKNMDDKEERISDYVGKSGLLFLDFWASWCGPCLAQEPHIAELYRKYKDSGFEVLGISLDINRAHWLHALKKKKQILWPELCVAGSEQEKELRELYSISGIPFGVLIDRSGKIVYVVRGHSQELKMVLEQCKKDGTFLQP